MLPLTWLSIFSAGPGLSASTLTQMNLPDRIALTSSEGSTLLSIALQFPQPSRDPSITNGLPSRAASWTASWYFVSHLTSFFSDWGAARRARVRISVVMEAPLLSDNSSIEARTRGGGRIFANSPPGADLRRNKEQV